MTRLDLLCLREPWHECSASALKASNQCHAVGGCQVIGIGRAAIISHGAPSLIPGWVEEEIAEPQYIPDPQKCDYEPEHRSGVCAQHMELDGDAAALPVEGASISRDMQHGVNHPLIAAWLNHITDGLDVGPRLSTSSAGSWLPTTSVEPTFSTSSDEGQLVDGEKSVYSSASRTFRDLESLRQPHREMHPGVQAWWSHLTEEMDPAQMPRNSIAAVDPQPLELIDKAPRDGRIALQGATHSIIASTLHEDVGNCDQGPTLPIVAGCPEKENGHSGVQSRKRVMSSAALELILLDLEAAEQLTFYSIFDSFGGCVAGVPISSVRLRNFLLDHSSAGEHDINGYLHEVAPEGILTLAGFIHIVRNRVAEEGPAIAWYIQHECNHGVSASTCQVALPQLLMSIMQQLEPSLRQRIFSVVFQDVGDLISMIQWMGCYRKTARIVRLIHHVANHSDPIRFQRLQWCNETLKNSCEDSFRVEK